MRRMRLFFLGFVIAVSPMSSFGETLEDYAKQCDAAIGVTVPDFVCDDGTEVPDTHPTSTPPKWDPATQRCDRPNHLNKECDPGSRFQVLHEDDKAFVVAHCRKRGHAPNNKKYKDIAVIQHSKKNGATCFYQALDENLDGAVKAPSKGIGAWPWKTPAQTVGIGCGACHDNGSIVRSPYLSQVTDGTGKQLLPSANSEGDPYYFVGADFAKWKAFEVHVTGNECNTCHRIGTNNVPIHGALGANGTARDFGIRATAKDQGLTQSNGFNPKNPLSVDSPMWMVPDARDKFNEDHAKEAKAIKACADKVQFEQLTQNEPGVVKGKLPNTDACRITQFAGRWKLTAVRWQGATAHFFMGHRGSVFDAKPEGSQASDPKKIEINGLGTGGIDAAILWGNAKAYLFIGDQYALYDLKTNNVQKGFPRPIAGHWPGVWADGVDAAVPWNNGKVYFFKGQEYVQYDVKTDKADIGYPKPIKDG